MMTKKFLVQVFVIILPYIYIYKRTYYEVQLAPTTSYIHVTNTSIVVLHNYQWAWEIWGCSQKFPDWPPGARTANGTAVIRRSSIVILWVSLVSFAATTLSVACQQVFIIVCYWLSPETFGYTLVCHCALHSASNIMGIIIFNIT
jgi:hypothetical protein